MSLFAASDRAWFLTGGVGTNCADQCASVGGRPREVALQAAEGIRSVLNGKLPAYSLEYANGPQRHCMGAPVRTSPRVCSW